MSNPPIGNNPMIHKWDSLKWVTQLSETRKNAEAEPDSIPMHKQITIHLIVVVNEGTAFEILAK
jgi:hypothetical protein